jgi:hypothetical protein
MFSLQLASNIQGTFEFKPFTAIYIVSGLIRKTFKLIYEGTITLISKPSNYNNYNHMNDESAG